MLRRLLHVPVNGTGLRITRTRTHIPGQLLGRLGHPSLSWLGHFTALLIGSLGSRSLIPIPRRLPTHTSPQARLETGEPYNVHQREDRPSRGANSRRRMQDT